MVSAIGKPMFLQGTRTMHQQTIIPHDYKHRALHATSEHPPSNPNMHDTLNMYLVLPILIALLNTYCKPPSIVSLIANVNLKIFFIHSRKNWTLWIYNVAKIVIY